MSLCRINLFLVRKIFLLQILSDNFQDFQNAITQKMKRSLGISTFRGDTDHMILPLEEFRGYSLKEKVV